MTDAMTDGSATPPSHDRSWRVPLLVGLLVLVIVLAVAFLVGRDDGDDEPSGQPSTQSSQQSSTAPSVTTSASGSATPTETPTSADPVSSPVIDKAVRAAMKDGFPAMVPAGVPAGWTVNDAAYSPKGGGSWRIDLTDPAGGEVVLVQSTQSLKAAVEQYLGADAKATGKVDLRDYGTGMWQAYEGGGHAGIGKELSNTSVLLHGTDQETLVTLAQELVTAEDYELPEAG